MLIKYNAAYPIYYRILTGLLTGLVGIGAGIVLFPALVHFNFTIPQAVAISLFLNAIPNVLPGLYLYYRDGHLNLRVGIIIAIGTLLGTLVGSYIGVREYITPKLLYRSYTLILCIIVVYMLYTHC